MTEKIPQDENAEIEQCTAYFQKLQNASIHAADQAGGFISKTYRIAGYRIELQFAGEALIPLMTPAITHLADEETSVPDLTVALWDTGSTSTAIPPLDWTTSREIFRGEVPRYNNSRFHTSYHSWAEVFSMLDSTTGQAVFWTGDYRHLDYTMGSAPIRDILHWYMYKQGVQLVHGGGVGTPNGGVLLTGSGGKGKSTSALACLDSNLFYAGDDHVLVRTAPKPMLHSIYNTAKLKSDNINTFPHLVSAIENSENLTSEKARIFLQDHYPERLIGGFPLRALLLPEVTGKQETRVERTSVVNVLRALAPTTLYQLPKAGQESLTRMAALAKSVPGYTLKLGTELPQIPVVISKLLKDLETEDERRHA